MDNLIDQCSDSSIVNLKTGKFYLGIDPTGEGIHIGHLIPIKLAITLLEKGMTGIILIGGFTGQIGDPTDKNECRKKLDENATNNFSSGILKDVQTIFQPFEKQITFVNNKDWLDSFKLSEYLNISYHISVSRKLHLETFQNRLSKSLSLSNTEFIYPDIQMIDFLHLFNVYNCNIQIGGADQWGNIAYGVHYVKKITSSKDIYGVCTPLLLSKGKKISKSVGSPSFVNDAFSLYQHCIQMSDETIHQLYGIFAQDALRAESHKIDRENIILEIFRISYPMDFIIKFKDCQNKTMSIFNKDITSVEDELFKETNSDTIINIIHICNSWSKSEIRRKLSENAISVNGDKITDNIILIQGKYKIKIGQKNIICVNII